MGHATHISERQRVAFIASDGNEAKGLVITDFEGLKGENLRKQDIYDGQLNLFEDEINKAIFGLREMGRVMKMPEVAVAMERLKALARKPPATIDVN